MKRALLAGFLFLASTLAALADDSPVIQNCINTGAQVPPGTYYIGTTLQIVNPVSLAWRGVVLVAQCSPCININEAAKAEIDYCTIVANGNIGIQVQGGNHGSAFNSIDVLSPSIGYNFLECDTWHIQEGRISQFSKWGVYVQNPGSPDSGDSEISSTMFSTSVSGAIGVNQISSDGLRLENDKFLGGNVAIQLEVVPGDEGDLLVEGCSIEGQSIAGVFVIGNFQNVLITGNEFELQIYPIYLQSVQYVTVTGNVINSPEAYGVLALFCNGVVGSNSIRATVPTCFPGSAITSY